MHASLLIIFLILFCRHIQAALGESHGHHHINLDGRKIQKRHDDGGSWDYTGDDTQSPAEVEIPEEVELLARQRIPTGIPKDVVFNDDGDEATAAPPKEETTALVNTELQTKNKRDEKDELDCKSPRRYYVFYNPLVEAAKRFCKEAGKQGVHDNNSGGISHRLPRQTRRG